MQRVKVRTFSGVVLEQEIYNISERGGTGKTVRPRLRFRSEEEREAHRLGISRRNFIRLINENCTPRGYYCTLTFSDDEEVHTFAEARVLRDNYVRRLRYSCPDAVIFIVMGRGKHTRRIHFHMVAEGIGEDVIKKKWTYGTVIDCEHLREHNFYDGIDCGADYTGLANYLFDHWTPEQGGHRYKATKNARKPQREDVRVIHLSYSAAKPPKTPKGYIYTGCKVTGYGYMCFKYVLCPKAAPEINARE